MTPRPAALALLMAAALPLQAAEWSLDSSLSARLRQDDERAPQAGAAIATTRDLRVGGTLAAARSLETQSTRLDLALDLPAWTPDAARTLQGRAALAQQWRGERDGVQGAAEWTADDTLDGPRSAADVLAGGSRRVRQQLSAAWQRQVDERLDTRLSWRRAAVRLDGAVQGGSYRESQLSATLDWRADERTRWSLTAGHGLYARDDGDGRTASDSLNVGATYALSETDSASAGIGLWRSRRDFTLRGQVCPLPEAFCSSGLVARVPVSQGFTRDSHGSQYSLGWQGQADERTRWSAVASRELTPGVLGVQQTDTLKANWERQCTPELTLAAAASQSRTSLPDAGGRRATLQTLESSVSWRLREDLTLSAGLTLRRLDGASAEPGGRGRQISISLQYQGPRLFASR